jgi:hypothetical protein
VVDCYVVESQGRDVTCAEIAAYVGRYAPLDSRHKKWHQEENEQVEVTVSEVSDLSIIYTYIA